MIAAVDFHSDAYCILCGFVHKPMFGRVTDDSAAGCYIFVVFLRGHIGLVIGIELVSEHAGAFPRGTFKQAGEVLRILESEVIGYDAYIVIGRGQSAFGFCDEIQGYDFLWGIACFAFDKVSEISWCQVCLVGKIRDFGNFVNASAV